MSSDISGRFPVNRSWQDLFCSLLELMDYDGYGYSDDGKPGYDCGLFSFRPYCWCETCENCLYEDTDREEPNFHYKPTDYRLWWYKYPLRAATANREVGHGEFETMIKNCMKLREAIGA